MKNKNQRSPFNVTFFTGIGSVTGANFLLEVGGDAVLTKPLRILVDCGLTQGEKMAEDVNREPFAYDPASMDCLFVTHAHLDHVGRIPKLVKDGFKGIIYSTLETKEIAKFILDDALGLLTKEAAHEGLEPLYGPEDVAAVFPLWKTIPYHETTEIRGGDGADSDKVSVYLRDAGHILGSAMIQFTYKNPVSGEEKNIVFTGDLGNSPTPLLRDTEAITGAEYLVMESVYGDRNHEPKDERDQKFRDIVNDTIKRGGTLLIPTFSVERTQVILYELNEMIEHNQVPSVPVFVDSPLAIKVTDIYKQSTNLFNEKVQGEMRAGDDLFNFPKLQFTLDANSSRSIDYVKGPKIIVAGSGMSSGGRILHHETLYLADPNCTVLFVGYQSAGTFGRRLADGAKEVNIAGVPLTVEAKIETIYGYSSHKDSDHLVEFVDTAKDTLKKIFVVMGEPKSSLFLAQKIRDQLGLDALYPEKEKEYDL